MALATSHLEYALLYGSLGWYVFPVGDDAKAPITTRGYHDASIDVAQITDWWTTRSTARIGLALRPSGLIAIDVDVADGKPGAKTIAGLETTYGALPRTLHARSGRGGEHFIMRDPSPGSQGWTRVQALGGACRANLNKAGCGAGVDIKCNGYIVVEPSGTYQWLTFEPTQLADVPTKWVALMRKPADECVLSGHDIAAWQDSTHALTEDEESQLRQMLADRTRGDTADGATCSAILTVCHKFGQSVDDGAEFLIEWNNSSHEPHQGRGLLRQIERVARNVTPDGERGWFVTEMRANASAFEFANSGKPKSRPGGSGSTPPPRSVPPSSGSAPPTAGRCAAALEAFAGKRGGTPDVVEARNLIKRARAGDIFANPQELAFATLAVAKVLVPERATAEQIAEFIRPCAGGAVIGDVDTVATLAFDKITAERSGEVPLDEFVIEQTGPNAGKVKANCQPNIDKALREMGISMSYDLLGNRKMIEQICEHPEVVKTRKREIVQDSHLDELYFKIEEKFMFKPEDTYYRKYLGVLARRNEYHPVLEYLAELPPHDGVPRVETWLIRLCGAKDTPLVRAVSRLVLVAAVRRIRQPGCKFDEMLVLESPLQGTTKTSFVRALCSNPDWFGSRLPLHADVRTQMEATAGKWIIESGELSGMDRADHRAMKDYLSTQVDEARMAYAHENRITPRHFIIIGTTNDKKYLKDNTGNRRYWPVEILRCDVPGLRVELDQLWAEAAFLEMSNPAEDYIRLSPELWEEAAAEQEERRIVDPFEDRLSDILHGVTGLLKIRDVYLLCGLTEKCSQSESQRIHDVMTRLGWTKGKRRLKKTPTGCYISAGAKDGQWIALKSTGGGETILIPAPDSGPN